MNTEQRDQFINSNCQNFLLASSQGKQVYRIQPDKFTFLKSNLLISNIVHRSSCKQKKMVKNDQLDESDAYINCQVEMQKLQDQIEEKKEKIDRVRNLAKCKSQLTFEQLAKQQKSASEKIQNVYLMRKQMVQKAAQIMGKKEDNSYLGRNLYQHKQKLLKQLKQINPTQKTQKSQTIRLLMKQNAKKCNRKQFKQILQDSATNLSLTKQMINSSSLNSSMELSLLDISNTKAIEQKVHNDEVLRKLLKCKSTESFMQEQKRRAVWNGFSEHWRKGCEKNEEASKTLKKKSHKKPQRPRFQTSDHEILNYNDQYQRFMALKKYETAFAQTSSSFKLNITGNVRPQNS